MCVCVSARYLPWSIFQVWQDSGLLKRFGPQGYSKCNVSWWGASCNYSICTEPGPREGPPGWEIRTCRSFDKCRIFLNISPWAQHVPTYWLYHVVSLFRFFGSWHKNLGFEPRQSKTATCILQFGLPFPDFNLKSGGQRKRHVCLKSAYPIIKTCPGTLKKCLLPWIHFCHPWGYEGVW